MLAIDIGARLVPPVPMLDAMSIYRAAAGGSPLPSPKKPPSGFVGCSFSEVPDTNPTPIWQDRVFQGGLTLFEGKLGVGSTSLICEMVAKVSRGQSIRGESVTLAKIAIVTSAADASAIFKPRLKRLQGDFSMIDWVKNIAPAGVLGSSGVVPLPERLGVYLSQHPDVKLLILDPLETVISRHGSKAVVHKELSELARIAGQYDVAMVGVGETGCAVTKEAIQVARTVWRLQADPLIQYRAILHPVKRGLGYAPALAVRIEKGVVTWEAEAVDDPQEVISGKRGRPRSEAREWLRSFLADGPKPATEVEREARQAGFSESTLDRAKKELGIKSCRQGTIWVWKLPDPCQPSEGEVA
jgi:hypothetical protein